MFARFQEAVCSMVPGGHRLSQQGVQCEGGGHSLVGQQSVLVATSACRRRQGRVAGIVLVKGRQLGCHLLQEAPIVRADVVVGCPGMAALSVLWSRTTHGM